MTTNNMKTALATVLTAALLTGLCTPALAAGKSAAASLNFLKDDLTGKKAAVTEQLLKTWGFGYWGTDGRWGDEDVYELKLFERWAGLTPDGKMTTALRKKLAATYAKYGEGKISRKKLPLEGRYVGINAGHQAKIDHIYEPVAPNKGALKVLKVSVGTTGVSTRVPEYKVTLQVAQKLQAALEAQGARVRMARTTNTVNIGNADRAKAMNAAGVDLVVALHCDGATSHSTHGLHTLQPVSYGYQTGTVLAKSKKLAAIIQKDEIKATGATNKGIQNRKDLCTLNWSKVPVCLVEMGYMSNRSEDKKLVSTAYQKKLAQGFVTGITEYYKGVK